jgi:hypothetical protein
MYGCRLRNAWFLLLLTICGASSLMVATALAAPLRANSAVVRGSIPIAYLRQAGLRSIPLVVRGLPNSIQRSLRRPRCIGMVDSLNAQQPAAQVEAKANLKWGKGSSMVTVAVSAGI